MNTPELLVPKSEILFLYDSTYSIPNGDPFTGEQRYDEETKRILVSDVRIKRYVRDYLYEFGTDIFVRNDRTNVKEKSAANAGTKQGKDDAESGAAARFNTLEKKTPGATALDILTSMIDVRLFGGISTKTGNAVNLTGPVQFALLNPSLNSVDLRMHQNTSVFASSTDKSRGAIGTTTVVPYALNQIHGWINPYSARHTKLAEADVEIMFAALWNGVNNANTRTKCNQASLLLLHVVYAEPNKKVYGLDRTIGFLPLDDKAHEQVRYRGDYTLDFSRLAQLVANESVVHSVNYYSQDAAISAQLAKLPRFGMMNIAI